MRASINVFNDSSGKVRVLLNLTKACAEGINFVGVLRVALLDIVWNPSIEKQMAYFSTEGFQTTNSKTTLTALTKLNPITQTSIKFAIPSPC